MNEQGGENRVIEYSLDMSRPDLRNAMAEFSLDAPVNKKSTRRVQIVYGVIAAIFLAVAVILYVIRREIGVVELIGFGVFAVIALIFRPVRKHQMLKTINSTYPSHTVVYSWSDEEIRTVSPVQESHQQWEFFHSVYEKGDFLILSGTNLQSAVCDKKAISPEELDALRGMIDRNVQ